ncbi:MAG: cytochrome c biogenesis protein CcsA [Tannerella sp.]|jgi:cytochrome c-type biogenesis protein CcsB|nr:cytochrome c biogenesis protein CcsA [Tannerella sp.]
MEQLKKTLSSYVTMTVLLIIYATALAAATFVEKAYGTLPAKALIYYSPAFFLLQFLLAVNFVLIMIRRRLYRSGRWGLLILHASFIVILAGALTSHLTGKEGVLHLREGEKSSLITAQTNRGQSVDRLPFEVELVRFTLRRYPGSGSPSSYESDLRIHVDGAAREAQVYMNSVLDVKGYRFFQASYDADERGTILSVNSDVAGRRITYAGYALLLAGCILCLVSGNGRIRTLYRQVRASRLFILLLLAAPAADAGAQAMSEAVRGLRIAPQHAELFGSLPVQAANGRIVPVNTFSSEVLRKVHREIRFADMDPDRFLLSVLAWPEMWMHVPVIGVGSREVERHFGLASDPCAYVEVFDSNGAYRLQEKLEEAYRKMPGERTAFDKELIRFDERINVFHRLLGGELIRLFPATGDPDGKWYAPGGGEEPASPDSAFIAATFAGYLAEVRAAAGSQNWEKADERLRQIKAWQYAHNNIPEMTAGKIELELKYNRMDVFRRCRIGYLSLGGLLLMCSFALIWKEKKWLKWSIRLLGIAVLIVFHYQMLGMGMRWKIGGHAPWSNSYETMVYAAWATVFAGLLFVRRSPVTFALATVFAGVILFVSGLSWMDPQINQLVPVLKSPWLMFHVAVIMSAYGFFGISFLIGLASLGIMSAAPKQYAGPLKELSLISEISLLTGLLLMATGTFMGAVWANESWGRYWGWDPKETWALITVIVYVLVTHLHLMKKQYSLWLFNLCSVCAFASVLMTYFGVNYFLSGMHSYGQSDPAFAVRPVLYAAGAVILLLAFFARKGKQLK